MCYFDELENSEIIPKNIAISLGELLTQFFGITLFEYILNINFFDF